MEVYWWLKVKFKKLWIADCINMKHDCYSMKQSKKKKKKKEKTNQGSLSYTEGQNFCKHYCVAPIHIIFKQD